MGKSLENMGKIYGLLRILGCTHRYRLCACNEIYEIHPRPKTRGCII